MTAKRQQQATQWSEWWNDQKSKLVRKQAGLELWVSVFAVHPALHLCAVADLQDEEMNNVKATLKAWDRAGSFFLLIFASEIPQSP